jgi:hypothetical protein
VTHARRSALVTVLAGAFASAASSALRHLG